MRKLVSVIVAAGCLCACNAVGSLLHDDELLATVGEHRLYAAEVASFIPAEVSSQDSLRLAKSYIDTWVKDKMFEDLAETELSKEEKDVSKELESYKRTLLRYRYEQKYINQRLDTAITPAQVEEYHSSHKAMFTLQDAIVKARYAVVPEKSSHLSALKDLMASADETDEIVVSDSLAYAYTSWYSDFKGKWIDVKILASDLQMEPHVLLASIKKGFVQSVDESGNLHLAYISELARAGSVAPVDYCAEQIRDIILSNRKQALLAALEQELLEKQKTKNE